MQYQIKLLVLGLFTSVFLLSGANTVSAHEHHQDTHHDHDHAEEAQGSTLYFWGEAKSISGSVKCAVKISDEGPNKIELEALLFQAHENSYVYTDHLDLNFDSAKNSYVFNSTESRPYIKQAVLFLGTNSEPLRFAASVFHHNHYDPAFCENLVEAQDAEALLVEDFFQNTIGTQEEDHDHDHDHDHDDDHDGHDH